MRDTETSLSSSSLLYTSSYPPDEFPTSSIIDDDLTSTSVVTTLYDKEKQLATNSTDEEDENHLAEQSNSPTHTISSSNGHDAVCFSYRIKSKYFSFFVFFSIAKIHPMMVNKHHVHHQISK
jgi:hypothetical protein